MQKTDYDLLLLGESQDQKKTVCKSKEIPPLKMSKSHNVSVI